MCSDRGDYEHFLNFGEIFRNDPRSSNDPNGDGVLYLKRLDCLESVKDLRKQRPPAFGTRCRRPRFYRRRWIFLLQCLLDGAYQFRFRHRADDLFLYGAAFEDD